MRSWIARIVLCLSALGCAQGVPNSGSTDAALTECTPSEKRCHGNDLLVCTATGKGWATVTCDNGCNAGQCNEDTVCASGEKKCVDDQQHSCDASGKWVISSCADGCANGECKAPTECTPGESVCEGSLFKQCKSDGTWALTGCELGCENNACKPADCAFGEKKCVTDQLWSCSSDKSWAVSDCPYGCSGNACQSAVCQKDQTQCAPDNAKQVQVCNAKRTGWDNQTLCTGYCNAGACAQFACATNANRCSPDGSKIETCNPDRTGWASKSSCEFGCVTDNKGEPTCAACPKDAKRCSNNSAEVCDPLLGWTTKTVCSSDKACVAGDCQYRIILDWLTQTENMEELAYWMADCWLQFGDKNDTRMCYVVDSGGLSTAIEASTLSAWICSGIGDGTITADAFASTSDDGADRLAAAVDIFACSGAFNGENFSFETSDGKLSANSSDKYCIYHDASWINEIFIDECNDFPSN